MKNETIARSFDRTSTVRLRAEGERNNGNLNSAADVIRRRAMAPADRPSTAPPRRQTSQAAEANVKVVLRCRCARATRRDATRRDGNRSPVVVVVVPLFVPLRENDDTRPHRHLSPPPSSRPSRRSPMNATELAARMPEVVKTRVGLDQCVVAQTVGKGPHEETKKTVERTYSFDRGAFAFTLVPVRPRWRGARRSLRTFALSRRAHHSARLSMVSIPTRRDAFQRTHPRIRLTPFDSAPTSSTRHRTERPARSLRRGREPERRVRRRDRAHRGGGIGRVQLHDLRVRADGDGEDAHDGRGSLRRRRR